MWKEFAYSVSFFFAYFSLPKKEYKRVLECNVSKNSMRGRGQSILKMVGAIIDSKIWHLLSTKEIQSFFCKTH